MATTNVRGAVHDRAIFDRLIMLLMMALQCCSRVGGKKTYTLTVTFL